MTIKPNNPDYISNIKQNGSTIYEKIDVGDPDLWIPAADLERLLDAGLRGLSLAGLALRTRSKVVKMAICEALGYPIPRTFTKTQPRFPSQDFDVYIQKANNLQIWNEEITPTRRYVLIRVEEEEVTKVKVISGEDLALLDRTGTLTRKYQARLSSGEISGGLITPEDTRNLRAVVLPSDFPASFAETPIDYPDANTLLPIEAVFDRLLPLLGSSLPALGYDQERNRGGELHRLVCSALGYSIYQDDGRFPDVKHQLIEVKLQTSPTIDLGLVLPSSTAHVDIPAINGVAVRHCDVRYAVFYGESDGSAVALTHLYLATGEGFFSSFTQFQGKVSNAKLQIPLPASFFSRDAEGLPD